MVLESNVNIPADGVKLQLPNTRAFISNNDFGVGLLCVAESNLVWKQENGRGLCFEYPHIALHAISTDLTSFPHECLYVMLDKNIMKGEEEEEEDNENDDENSDNLTEIRFVPSDKTLLNELFLAMNDCQALYPDEDMSGDEVEEEEEDENEDYYEEGEDEENGQNGQNGQNGNNQHQNDENDEFADAD